MNYKTLVDLINEESELAVAKAVAQPAIDGVELITKMILNVTITLVKMAQDEIKQQVLQMGAAAARVQAVPQMQGYAEACNDVVKEIDRLALPIDVRGSLLPGRT